MSRALFAAVAVLPLVLAAGSAVAQSHGGHGTHAAPARPPQARPTPKPKPRAAAPQPRRVAPPAQTPAIDPHAGHDMGGMSTAPAAAAPATAPQSTAKTCTCPKCAEGAAAHDCAMPGADCIPLIL